MKRILHVVGARPNFMKAAPLVQQMALHPSEFHQTLLHTGQHYDHNMSKVFFDELGLPQPNINLEVGSGSHAEQTANVMMRFEKVVLELKPDWVIVYGDVNSTLACALVCAKLGVKVAHVEAGLRSYDRTMPEEFNRLVTDQLADLLFTPSPDADVNLHKEGIPPARICLVGNIMIDTLVRLLPKAQEHWTALRERLSLKEFILVTLHRPCNVDNIESLLALMRVLREVGQTQPVIFPVHPRTQAQLAAQPAAASNEDNVQLIAPLGYLDFLALQQHARLVVTDSGGVQEETTYLGTPCLTIRPNTERPATITHGTNRLVWGGPDVLQQAMQEALRVGKAKEHRCPPLWDGRTASRIVDRMRQ